MTRDPGDPHRVAVGVVAAQLGRAPRGRWRVSTECRWGWPTTIRTDPVFDDGRPFPTALWLTCPWLVREVGRLESSGQSAVMAMTVTADAEGRARMEAAARDYGAIRRRLGGGTDPCAGTGIAGQRDLAAVKCLHARVAAVLGGVDDPVGAAALVRVSDACPDGRCSRLQAQPGG